MDTIKTTQSENTWECSRHGKHDAIMHVLIHGVLKRVFCVHCYVEQLDKLGVKEMHETKRDN